MILICDVIATKPAVWAVAPPPGGDCVHWAELPLHDTQNVYWRGRRPLSTARFCFFLVLNVSIFFLSLVDESNLKSITAFNSTGGVEIVELCATVGLLLVPRDVGTHGSLLIWNGFLKKKKKEKKRGELKVPYYAKPTSSLSSNHQTVPKLSVNFPAKTKDPFVASFACSTSVCPCVCVHAKKAQFGN